MDSPVAPAVPAAVTICRLRCEYRENPLGIDVSRPRLQWLIQSPERGTMQAAYQVLVASSEALLATNSGDLWDSGIVASARSTHVEYDGHPLLTGQHCHWKVRVWITTCESAVSLAKQPVHSEAELAAARLPAAWSQPALWSIGLLGAEDWEAAWIGCDAAYELPPGTIADDQVFHVQGLNWVAFADANTTGKGRSPIHLRKRVYIPPRRGPIRRAVLALYAFHACAASINGTPIGEAVHWERTARLDATHVLNAGDNILGLIISHTDPYSPAAIGRLVVQFMFGPDLVVPLDQSCRVAQQKLPENWTAIDFDDSDGTGWHAASEFNYSPWRSTPSVSDLARTPAPYLRKEFTLDKPGQTGNLKRAMLYVTALGVYEMRLNGKRVGLDVLAPGWPEFRNRVPYQTYDVTALVVAPGRNAFGAILGDGWYASDIGHLGRRNNYGGRPRLMAQLVIEFDSPGNSISNETVVEIVSTDATWKAAFGPIVHADLLFGCEVDARRQLVGWDNPGYDDGDWDSVAVNGGVMQALALKADYPRELDRDYTSYAGQVDAAVADASRVLRELPAVSLTEPRPGCYTFDVGQVMVGWVRFKVRNAAGHRITLRYGEMLNDDGSIYTANLRACPAADVYTPAGNDEQTFEPIFTFHGFRYVEVRGLPAAPRGPNDIVGLVVNTPMEQTGHFKCSHPLLNQLFSNIVWSNRGNFLEVPTDCPQRDERLGWSGDVGFFVSTASFNFDVASFFTRWLTSCRDAQFEDGTFPNVVPDALRESGSTAWGDAALLCAYRVYRIYDDTRLVAAHFDAMERYMSWLAGKTENGISAVGGFGDWLNAGGGADGRLIDTAYHAHLAAIMAEMAAAIGKTAQADHYKALHANIKAAFADAFILPDGGLKDSSQTGHALAFTMDLVPAPMRAKMAAKFIGELARFDNHLATGFIGTPRLLPGLRIAGLEQLAHQLLLTETYPSWLFPVTIGATSCWERWGSFRPDSGFGDISMNSFNHYAFGAVGEYLYTAVGGIQPTSPGCRTIDIHPVVDHGLSWAETSFDCPFGPVSTRWERHGDGALTLSTTIPANTTATVHIPIKDDSNAAAVTEGTGPAAQSLGVTLLRSDPGAIVFLLGSGEYKFHVSA